MRVYRLVLVLTLLFALVASTGSLPGALVEAAPPSPPSLTGDASMDFAGYPGVYSIFDPQDVGLPANAPPGTISGWDLSRVRLYYDGAADKLYVGIECFGVICGDADGDGDPGGTSTWLAANGGVDAPDLGGSESIAVYLDTDKDGTFDVAIGVSSLWDDASDFDIYRYNPLGLPGPHPSPLNFGSFYDVMVPNNRLPNAHVFVFPQTSGKPDFEFVIQGFSTLPGISVVNDTVSFGIEVRAGANGQDDGIGEDIVVLNTVTAIELISFDARVGPDGQVILQWTTGTEINNAGFNIYRGDMARNQWVQINAERIAPQGSEVSGASYTFVDRPGPGTFYYMLEDVDTSGVRTQHDPVQVTVPETVQVLHSLFLPTVWR